MSTCPECEEKSLWEDDYSIAPITRYRYIYGTVPTIHTPSHTKEEDKEKKEYNSHEVKMISVVMDVHKDQK
jgi:hypothetical protein